MCKFKSLILLKDRVYISQEDSHSTMLEELNIKDESNSPEFVRVELIPPNREWWKPIDEWKYVVDQDYIPNWYVEEYDISRVRDCVRAWLQDNKYQFNKDKNLGLYNTGDSNTGDSNTGDSNTGDYNTGNRNTGDWNTGNWNTGNRNTGDYNTGNRNTGNWNTGDYNTGDWNTGNWNTGNRNTGDSNTGDYNTGDWNTGDYNTGNWNTGDSNTGNWNTGNRNTGDYNTGNRNTGSRNTGNRNTGDWNKCNHSTGIFNTQERTITIFNIDSGMTYSEFMNSKYAEALYSTPFRLTEWIWYTDDEKRDSIIRQCIGGYLKKYTYQEACANWWDSLSTTNKKIIQSIPNFDSQIFKEITGIEV